MKYLFILNDSAYGSERSYNALRLAGTHARIARSGHGSRCDAPHSLLT